MKNSFKPERFYNELPDTLGKWLSTGMEEFRDLIDDPKQEWAEEDTEADIKKVYVDGDKVVVIDVSGGCHLFRFHLERL